MNKSLDVVDVDLTEPGLYTQGFPHELFTDLRSRAPVLRHRPVTLVQDGSTVEFWVVLTHQEIRRVNRDWETFSSNDGPTIAPFPIPGMTIVSTDPPEQTRMRGLISAAFSPRMVLKLEALIKERTKLILDAAEAKRDVEFVADVANQLPVHVIADIVGIPEESRAKVFTLSDIILRSFDPQQGISNDERQAAQIDLFMFSHELSAEKRARPADDVLSILASGPLSEFEVDTFLPIFVTAGSETVRNTLSQGLIALLEYPEQLAKLRAAPELIDTAVEELLRWASPAISFARTVTRDVELGGQLLRAQDRVAMFYPSGNRDERVFPDPFRFDISRSPNPHVTFGGGGPHYCLGANLAKIELRVMVSELLRRFSHIEVTGSPKWTSAGPSFNIGVAIQSLPARLVV